MEFPYSLFATRYSHLYAITGLGAREIISVISAATMHSAPAAKKAGRYVAHTVRDNPAPKAAVAAPSWWPAKIQPNTKLARSGPNRCAVSRTVGGTVAIQSRP